MPKLSNYRKAFITGRTLRNIVVKKPITVSFEVTYNCNADCFHCDLGEYVKEPKTGSEVYADWIEQLKPSVAQISGGEPLLRKDILDIIRAMRKRDNNAVFVITTNVALMNEEKYLALREAGIDQFSLSLDYPDERHNEYRKLKGNFEYIRDLMPRLAKHKNDDLILACVVQSDNFRDLPKMAELAKEWGVSVNFSIYNSLRTGNTDLLVNDENDQKELSKVVDKLVEMQDAGYPILTSEITMRQMIDFFKTGCQTDCQAGYRFMIVNPWGKLTPCGMCRDMYESQHDMITNFSQANDCDKCFTAIRANSEKSLKRLMADALRVVQKRNGHVD